MGGMKTGSETKLARAVRAAQTSHYKRGVERAQAALPALEKAILAAAKNGKDSVHTDISLTGMDATEINGLVKTLREGLGDSFTIGTSNHSWINLLVISWPPGDRC